MTTHDNASPISPAPPGFERLKRGGPYMANLGDLYCRRNDGEIVIAMRIDERHTNMRGIAHGGMLSSLADSALGLGLTLHCEGRHSFVTVNLSTDFVAFANCFLQVGERRILRASGVFAVMNALSAEQLAKGY
jgi:hypothetical protein